MFAFFLSQHRFESVPCLCICEVIVSQAKGHCQDKFSIDEIYIIFKKKCE